MGKKNVFTKVTIMKKILAALTSFWDFIKGYIGTSLYIIANILDK